VNSLLILALALASPQALYHRLDPFSVTKQLAYHELYPETEEGQKALARAWELLGGTASDLPFEALSPQHMVDMLQGIESGTRLDEASLEAVEQLGRRLQHHHLAGHTAWTREEVLALPDEEVDVARGLLIELFNEDRELIRSYEALLDLMALQILARTSLYAPAAEKIAVINWFLFDEMHLRFPPHSAWATGVDDYTFLPSILDSRRGVCLGVSTLYLCIAQRLDLHLEAITPPGHIYLRTSGDADGINIETTARGVHIPSDHYLSVHTRSLQTRNRHQVIGYNFFNQAGTLWQAGRLDEAIAAYHTTLAYSPGDSLATELLGYVLLIDGQKEEAFALLSQVRDYLPDYAVTPNCLIADVLDGRVDASGVAAVYQQVDETRESILEKQEEIRDILTQFPLYRQGWFHLAVTHLQLGRNREGLEILQHYHTLNPDDATAEYYLAALNAERYNYPAAWAHLARAEALTATRDYSPKPLEQLRRSLRIRSPS
jgi:tetratricopeptide (TPR) repeat protein